MSRLMKRSQTTKRSGESAEGIGNRQIHYMEVVQGDILMEQKMRFGLVLGGLAILKKNQGPIMSTSEGGFFMFSGTKIQLQIIRYAEYQHIRNQLCIAEDTSLRDFYIMTLVIEGAIQNFWGFKATLFVNIELPIGILLL